MICYSCHAEGHIEANCPNAVFDASGRPSWCGVCDERTRLIDSGTGPARCQQCHPNRHKLRSPLRRCPSCHMTVYDWDHAPCGEHASPAALDRRPDRDAIRQAVAAEYQPGDAA